MPFVQTPVSHQTMRAIILRHQLATTQFSSQPWFGGGSAVYQVGNAFVLKVPHLEPTPGASVAIEAAASTAARAAGVRTPALIVFDDACDLLPVPYLVFEHIPGEPLSHTSRSPVAAKRALHALGGDLALLHGSIRPHRTLQLLPTFAQTPDLDPRPWVADVHRAGGMTAVDARWLGDILEGLAPTVLAERAPAFCHGDVNAANVMVDQLDPPSYVALLDWGGAGWADPASDFAALSLESAPFVLAGYRAIASLDVDNTMESRVLWFYLRLALFTLRRTPVADAVKTERIARLLRHTRDYLAWAHLA
jgi:aminoglycoside phosphotransferase (APT) family kinase protein